MVHKTNVEPRENPLDGGMGVLANEIAMRVYSLLER